MINDENKLFLFTFCHETKMTSRLPFAFQCQTFIDSIHFFIFLADRVFIRFTSTKENLSSHVLYLTFIVLSYRMCHGFRLTNWDDYFKVTFDHFWIEHHFSGYWGSSNNWHEPINKFMLANTAIHSVLMDVIMSVQKTLKIKSFVLNLS